MGTFIDLIESDPMLRLYCAVERSGAPYPPHPTHPGRTTIADAPTGDRIAADRLLVPLVRTFRIAADRYGVVIPPKPRFELLPDGRPAGRIVLEDGSHTATDVGQAAERLAMIIEMIAAIGRSTGADTPAVEELVQHTLATELRFLEPRTAGLLEPVGGPAVHSITPGQHRVLTDVLARVAERGRRCRTDARARRPAVVLDLDLCALDPRARVREALSILGVDPDTLATLPQPHRPAWDRWTRESGQRIDHEAFCDALYVPRDRLRQDLPAPGLTRFVWQVYDAGGHVIFNTGRRERVRAYTEYSLARAGIVGPRIAMLPDDRTRPVHELKSENLRAFTDLDIVAIFDDICENREAAAKEVPDALCVAVALPGYTPDPANDGAPVIATFETVPRTGRTSIGPERPALSDTSSLAELPLAELSPIAPPSGHIAIDHAVHLSEKESMQVVATLLAGAESSAASTARNVPDHSSGNPIPAIHHLLTRERFRKGAKGNFPLAIAEREMRGYVADGAPISVVTFGFPVKIHNNELKTLGTQPDLGELGALIRLTELHRTIQQVYPPGLAVTVLTDGNRYTRRSADILAAYQRKLNEYAELAGCRDFLRIVDFDQAAEQRFGPGIRDRRDALIERIAGEINEALAGLDIGANPIEMLERATARCSVLLGRPDDHAELPKFKNLFWSLVYSVPIVAPAEMPRAAFAQRVYSDLFHLTDSQADRTVLDGRRAVLIKGWIRTVRYLATLWVDRDVGYDDAALFPRRIRLTLNPRPGSLGFTYLGGSAVLPWHGTAVVDVHGRLSTDFAVSLLDQGFVPVYSPLLGPEQPWVMVPVTKTHHATGTGGLRLDPDFLAMIKLRRR